MLFVLASCAAKPQCVTGYQSKHQEMAWERTMNQGTIPRLPNGHKSVLSSAARCKVSF